MPHLHLSLQSGDDMILKRMKRRHSRADAIRFCERVRRLRPDIVFGADLIAGFPTETEAMFENSLRIVEECGLTHLHVFPFSPRPARRRRACRRSTVPWSRSAPRGCAQPGKRPIRQHLAGEQSAPRRKILVERGGFGRTEHFILAEIRTCGAGRDRAGAHRRPHRPRARGGGGLMAEVRRNFSPRPRRQGRARCRRGGDRSRPRRLRAARGSSASRAACRVLRTRSARASPTSSPSARSTPRHWTSSRMC